MAAAEWALLVIDMQNDFCLPGARLCVAGAMGCLGGVQAAVAAARRAGVPVYWVVRQHAADGSDVELSRRHLFPPGVCVAGTPGAALVDGLSPAPGEETVAKTRFSAFHATALRADLAARGVTRLALAGVQTPNCIRATAYDALALDVPTVVVLSDATAAATPFVQQANLYDLRCAGAEVLAVDEWAHALGLEGEAAAGAAGGDA